MGWTHFKGLDDRIKNKYKEIAAKKQEDKFVIITHAKFIALIWWSDGLREFICTFIKTICIFDDEGLCNIL